MNVTDADAAESKVKQFGDKFNSEIDLFLDAVSVSLNHVLLNAD